MHSSDRDELMMSSADVNTRATFIARTYMHLLGAIVAFTLLEVILFKVGIAQQLGQLMMEGGGMMWLAILGGFMVMNLIASHFAHNVKSLGGQYLGLGLGIAAQTIIFMPMLYIANTYFDGVIQNAALVTLAGFAALTAIVFITRKDFSFMRSFLMFASVLAIIAIIGSIIFGYDIGFYFSIAMVALAGGYILYDTSNVLHHFPEDRYVGASLELFASVMLLFWYVLRMFMSRD